MLFLGLVGELHDIEDVNEQQCLECTARHPDEIVGMKVRLTAQIANKGKHEHEAYRYCMRIVRIWQMLYELYLIWID